MRGYNIDDYIGKRFNHLILIKNLNKIDKHNSKIHVGYFNTLENAIKARKDAEEKYFKPI